FRARHRTVADDPGEEIIGDRFDLALLQRAAWRHRRHLAAELRFGHAIAAPVAVRELVVGGHRLARSSAHDHLDELGTIEMALPQVGAGGGLRFASAIAGPAVTERALRLVLIQAAPIG